MKKHLSICITLIMLICACKKETHPSSTRRLVACIEPLTSDTVYVNQNFYLSSCTQGATSYLWNYGDSNPNDTTALVYHTYTRAGTYTLSLTPYNSSGAGTPKIINITVLNQ